MIDLDDAERLLRIPRGRVLVVKGTWQEEYPGHPDEDDPLHWRPKAMNGEWRVVMECRREAEEAGRPVLSLSSDVGGGIELAAGAVEDNIVITIGATASADVTGGGVWEVAAYRVGDPDEVVTLGEGPWTTDPRVVRP